TLRPNPYNDRLLSDDAYNPLWDAAQERDCTIAFHEGTTSGKGKPIGADRVRSFAAQHIASHTVEMMFAALNIIWGGVAQRYPKLRFGFLEAGGGWITSWLDRMDRHFTRKDVFDVAGLSMKPSEYFKRQCWISFEPIENSLAYAAEQLGGNKIL